jgi:2-oxoisovalerate dehydrogenase E2 component (dihydrolipoyl transacylase)
MSDFVLPDLGEGLESAEIVAWHVQVGDEVVVDQVIVDVETAKAAVEVPVPFAGTVSKLHAQAGETVTVGAPLISVEPRPVGAGGNGFREPGTVTPDAAADEGSGSVLIGYGTTAPQARGKRRRRAAQPVAADAGADVGADARADARADGPVAVISPLVRTMARDAGIDLRRVRGGGHTGVVRRRDVEREIASRATPRDTNTADASKRIPMTGLVKATADKLSRSRREIPEATVWVDVDATELLAARATLNSTDPDRPVSIIGLLARFAVLGLRRYPLLNARVDPDEIVVFDRVNLGVAVQGERGLVVPVARGADQLSTRDLSAQIAALTERARSGSSSAAELSGGTFTVNNYGVFGVDGSAAIINHPEVAILGIGRIVDRPWVLDGALAVRAVTQLTLAFDHRVCDGATAGGFLRYVADCVEAPIRALGDL